LFFDLNFIPLVHFLINFEHLEMIREISTCILKIASRELSSCNHLS
jgi:hypothetical protein